MIKIKNKNLIVLVSLLFLIFFTGCSNIKSETDIFNEDKKVTEKFLNSYLEQLEYSEEEWENLIEHLDSKRLSDDPWIIQWEEILTEKEIERLIKNRLLPNLSLKEYPGTEYIIEELKPSDDSNSYSVSIKFKNMGNKSIDRKINISLSIVDTEQGRRINYINFEEFNSLFEVKK